MFELLDKWIKQVGEGNVSQVLTNDHSNSMMTSNKYYLNFYLENLYKLLCTMLHRVVKTKAITFVLDTMCQTLPWLDVEEGYITKWLYL